MKPIGPGHEDAHTTTIEIRPWSYRVTDELHLMLLMEYAGEGHFRWLSKQEVIMVDARY